MNAALFSGARKTTTQNKQTNKIHHHENNSSIETDFGSFLNFAIYGCVCVFATHTLRHRFSDPFTVHSIQFTFVQIKGKNKNNKIKSTSDDETNLSFSSLRLIRSYRFVLFYLP